MRVLVARLKRRAVPAMQPELVLTLVQRDLHALYRRRRDVRVSRANVVLRLTQARVRLADGVQVERRLGGQVKAEYVVGVATATYKNGRFLLLLT